MKSKGLLTLIGSICLILVLAALPFTAACAPEEVTPPPEEEVPAPPVFEWPESILIATPSSGDPGYLATMGWAPVMESMTGAKVRVTPEGTEAVAAGWLNRGEIDAWTNSMATAANVIEATHGFQTRDAGPFPLAMVWTSTYALLGMITRGDSEIETWDDIKPGHRFGVWADAPDFVQYYHFIRTWLGFTEEELIAIPYAGIDAAAKSVMTGRADLALGGAIDPFAIEIAAGPHGIRWISFPREEVEGYKRALREVTPMFPLGENPEGWGLKEAWGHTMKPAMFVLFCHANADPDLMYHLAKWLDENYDAFKDKNDFMPSVTREIWRSDLNKAWVPVHEGGIRYLKEIGMWTEADDARQEYNTKLIEMYIEAYKAALEMADAKGIKVDPVNDEWTELWENYKEELGLWRLGVVLDSEIQKGLAQM